MTFKIGDSVKIIKRLPDNITGTEEWNKPNGDVGKTGKIRSIVDSNRFEVTDGAIYYGYFENEELELLEESKSLVGRYLKALKDAPNSGNVKKGEYGKITKVTVEGNPDFACFPSQSTYGVVYDGINCKKYKLMPEGFNPDDVKETSSIQRISFYVKYCEEFTEDLFNKLHEWARANCKGLPRDYKDTYQGFKDSKYYLLDNFGFNSSVQNNNTFQFGVDNNTQGIKTEYSIQQVKDLIGYEETAKFIVGKWYKYTGEYLSDGSYYAKYLKTDSDNKFHYSERIFNKEYANKTDWSSSNCNPVLLTDLSEIQEYLPDGYVDKLPHEIPVTKQADPIPEPDMDLLAEAKRRYPVGSKVMCLVDNKEETILTSDFELYNGPDKDIKLRSFPHTRVRYNGVWATTIDEVKPIAKSESPINTYGLKVGDVLPENIISKWCNRDNNQWSNKWETGSADFINNRTIKGFDIKDGIPAFSISDTMDLWARCEGFKDFKESFGKKVTGQTVDPEEYEFQWAEYSKRPEQCFKKEQSFDTPVLIKQFKSKRKIQVV